MMQLLNTGSATTTTDQHRLHEETAVNALGHPTINAIHAAARRHDFQVEAERGRQIAQARPAQPVVPSFRHSVRWTVGVRVIRAGERILGGGSALATQPSPSAAVCAQ